MSTLIWLLAAVLRRRRPAAPRRASLIAAAPLPAGAPGAWRVRADAPAVTHRAAGLRHRQSRGSDAALDLRARLSELRDPVLRRVAARSGGAAGRAADRDAPGAARAPADRRRPHQPEPEAQQHRQGLARRDARLDHHRGLQRADAGRLRPAPDRRVAPRHRPRLRAADRVPAARDSGPSSNARSSTPIRRAGSISPTRSARASRRARPCCGGARCCRRRAASRRSRSSWPRMRPPPRWSSAQGLRVRLVDAPFGQPLGFRRATEVWNRQVRWARLRRASFPAYFLPEILTGGLPPIACCALAAGMMDLPVPTTVAAFAAVWYGGRVPACPRGAAGSFRLFRRSPSCCATCCCRCSGSRAGSARSSSGAATKCDSGTRTRSPGFPPRADCRHHAALAPLDGNSTSSVSLLTDRRLSSSWSWSRSDWSLSRSSRVALSASLVVRCAIRSRSTHDVS